MADESTRRAFREEYARTRESNLRDLGIARANREPAPIVDGLGDVIERIRAKAAAVGATIEDAPEAPVDIRTQRMERRRARLESVAGLDPDAVAACLASLDRCPRIVGHPGSEAAAAAVERFGAERGLRTLLLAGPTGRGKSWAATFAACLDATTWISAPADVRVGDAWDGLRARAVRAPTVVIDDLGREPNDWAARETGDLLEARHNAGRKTLATTNLPLRLEDLPEAQRAAWKGRTIADRYGDRLASRLSDARTALVVLCGGPDLRRAR